MASIKKHKTGATMGSAFIVMNQHLYDEMMSYLQFYREQFAPIIRVFFKTYQKLF